MHKRQLEVKQTLRHRLTSRQIKLYLSRVKVVHSLHNLRGAFTMRRRRMAVSLAQSPCLRCKQAASTTRFKVAVLSQVSRHQAGSVS